MCVTLFSICLAYIRGDKMCACVCVYVCMMWILSNPFEQCDRYYFTPFMHAIFHSRFFLFVFYFLSEWWHTTSQLLSIILVWVCVSVLFLLKLNLTAKKAVYGENMRLLLRVRKTINVKIQFSLLAYHSIITFIGRMFYQNKTKKYNYMKFNTFDCFHSDDSFFVWRMFRS